MNAGDIVRVKELSIVSVDGNTFVVDTNEMLVILTTTERCVNVKSLTRGQITVTVDKGFVELVQRRETVPGRLLGKMNFNPVLKLSKQDILALIDLALDTGDEEWFNELHSKLSALA